MFAAVKMSATFDFDKFIHRFIEIATSDCSIKGTLISATVTGSVKDPNVQVFQTVTIATQGKLKAQAEG